jgi:tetratricopeptide (TPR) repeat protein
VSARSSRIRILFIIFLSGLVALSVIRCHTPVKTQKAPLLSILDTARHYLNINDSVKYVGARTCMLCHQDIYNSFIHTGMGESFDVASKAKSSAKFGPHVVVHDKDKDFYYHPYWKNDSLYVLEFRLQGKDTIYKREQQINYIIGSGQHTNSHIYRVNGYLFQAPITFYTQEGKWDLAPGFSDGFNSRFSREVGLECMNCHNSYPNFVQGSNNKFSGVPNGIECERCHGAGELHVQAVQLGHKVDTAKEIDYTIVNPAKLPVDLQVDVCQRCHLQGNAVLKPGKSFYDFRPGMKLSDIEDVFMPKYEGMENEYIMASHIARLKMSQCYLQSLPPQTPKGALNSATQSSFRGLGQDLKPYQKSLTCVTCHNPHVDVRSVTDNSFNTICQNCHEGNANGKVRPTCTEKIEVREKVNDNCVSCHMPKGNTIDIPHVITTDHYIRIPVKKEYKENVKKFITLYDVNNPNPSAYTIGRAFIQQFASFQSDRPVLLDSAQHYFPDTSPSDIKMNISSLIDISFYKNDYQKLLYYVGIANPQYLLDSILVHYDYSNTDAWTSYRIGEGYFQMNDLGKAYSFYKRATQLAPYILDFQNKYGVTLAALNKSDEAENVCDFILAQNPEYVSALTNKGFLELKKGNADVAKQCYDKALSFNPDDRQALMNMAGWYVFKKQYFKTKEYLEMVLKKYPDDKQAAELLSKILAIVGPE